MPNDLWSSHRYAFAESTAKTAGRQIQEQTERSGQVKDISTRELVTQMDRRVEKFIIQSILDDFPCDGILGEESGHIKGDSGYLWVIDPIDGTTNYANHIPIYCVSIAVLKDNIPIIGVVYDPNRGDYFRAVCGGGAYCGKTRLNVSEVPLSPSSVLGFSSRFIQGLPSHVTKLIEHFDEYRNLGSAVLHLCYTAQGWFDGAFAHSTRLWDIAAGGLIVEEAGGYLRDFFMEPIFPLSCPPANYTANYVPFVAAGTLDNIQSLNPFFKQDSSIGPVLHNP